jgi:hypothetical protein
MNAPCFEIESDHVNGSGVVIAIQTDVSFPWAASSAPTGTEFFEDIPESFQRAMESFYGGRVVDADFALNNPSARSGLSYQYKATECYSESTAM